jgi:dipeptidase E
MALFLGGGGDPPLSLAVDEAFGAAVGGQLVVYLPTALGGTALYAGAGDWFAEAYGPLGVTTIETWHDLDGRSFLREDDLAGVYLGGGNTYLLLRELRRAGLDIELRTLIERGVHVYGGSAGAIVLGSDISTSGLGGDEPVDGLVDSGGLDVLAGWSVSCHYTPEHDSFLEDWTLDPSHSKVLVLCEDAGVVVDGERFIVLARSGAGLRQRSDVAWVTVGSYAWPPSW